MQCEVQRSEGGGAFRHARVAGQNVLAFSPPAQRIFDRSFRVNALASTCSDDGNILSLPVCPG